MRAFFLAIAACCALAGPAPVAAATLSKAEAELLLADAEQLIASYERGDTVTLIEKTHPSLHRLAGGREAYTALVERTIAHMRLGEIKFLETELALPVEVHPAGKEEVCFIPRVSILELNGARAKSTSYLVAIRRKGEKEWKYLDGSGFSKHPQLVYQLLPALDPTLSLPPNGVVELTAEGKENLISHRWTKVDENHAEMSFEGRDYILDSYVVLFEQPYYVHVRAQDGRRLDTSKALEIAEDYIRPRGCTQPLERRPDLDAGTGEDGAVVLGFQC